MGLLAGLAGHGLTRTPPPPGIEVEDDAPAGSEPAAAARRVWEPPMPRLLPVVAVAVLAIVAAVARVPPQTQVVLVAVGLLGLAVAHALAAQERRIRELERRLRDLER